MRQMEENMVFWDHVCKQVRTRQMHPEIREELLGHIEDRAELLMLEGHPEEFAVQEAVKQMGIRGYRQKPAFSSSATVGLEGARYAGPVLNHWTGWYVECLLRG